MNQPVSKDQSNSITCTREFLTAMMAYAVVFIVSVFLLKHGPSSAWWRIPLALAPIVPIFFALRAFLHFFQRMDELQRRIQLEALAFSFGVTCVVAFSYGLLENTGFPTLSWLWVPPLMIALWGIGTSIAARRYQ